MSMSQFLTWLDRNGFGRSKEAPGAKPKLHMPVGGETRSADSEELRVHVVMTTPTLDRQGDIVVPTGVRLEAFRRNPVVLWAHRYDMPPVGAVDVPTLRVGPKGIEADVVFDGGSAAGREVHGLYRRGVLRAWSVGFIPLKHEVIEDRGSRKVTGYRVTEWELLELSAVPVPANPEALTRRVREMEAEDVDDALLPVLHALKAAAGGAREPSQARALQDRIEKLEAALAALAERAPTATQPAAGPNTGEGKVLAEAIASEVTKGLPGLIGRLVAAEFHRIRGGV